MFQVLPEPEFEAWYEQLPEPLAEEVATAIDLVATSSEVAPERLSRLLLWFDGTAGSSSSGLSDPVHGPLTLSELPSAKARQYLQWHHEILLCLESPVFQQRLARLDPKLAALALRQVEHLKRRLRGARASSSYATWSRAASSNADPGASLGLRQAFGDLLELVGLSSGELLGSGSGLRELTILNVSPGLRVLFGLDFPGRRLIAILGETLDRRYYGDSVRRAEQSFRRYCAGLSSERGVDGP